MTTQPLRGDVEASNGAIRVLLVDDHPVVVEGMRALLDREADLEVIATATSGTETLAAARATQPDIVLLDLRIAPPSGPDLITAINEVASEAKVVILTSFSDDADLIGTISAGARGYMLKGSPVDGVIEAIRQVHRGESYIESSLSGRLIEAHAATRSRPHDPHAASPAITEREHEVLRKLVAGETNQEIAAALYISPRTVRAHLGSLYEKLGVHDRTAAAMAALKLGLVQLDEIDTEAP